MNSALRHRLHTLWELLPSAVFFLTLSASGNIRAAGWLGAISAGAVCASYVAKLLSPHGIMLGINIHLLLFTPAIEFFFATGHSHLAAPLVSHAQALVLVSIFAVGALRTLLTPGGFFGRPKAPKQRSFILLAIAFAAVLWTFTIEGNRFLQVGLPMTALFLAYRHLQPHPNAGQHT